MMTGQITSEPVVGSPLGESIIIVVSKPSSTPMVIGILMLIAGLFTVLGAGWDALNMSNTAAALADIDADVPDAWLWGSAAEKLVSGIILGAGGALLMNRKKLGVWLGLGSVAMNLVMGIIASRYAGEITEAAGGTGYGDVVTGMSLVFTFVCNGICGLIIAIPLMVTNNNLE